MASGSYKQVYAKCPFYLSDDGSRRIYCEGLGDASRLSLYYRTREEYERQMEVFCCGEYPRCEVYRALMEKYEEE